MNKVTEADFEKVRTYLSVMTSNTPPHGSNEQYAVKSQAYQAALPAATFLINYHFTVIEPDNGERSIPGMGNRPYNSTVTERAIGALNNNFPWHGNFGEGLLQLYPNLLEGAILHYKAAAKQRLKEATEVPLRRMTGEQLLLILQEHDRRKTEGTPLMMPVKDGSGKVRQVYQNPYEIVAASDQVHKADSDQSTPPGEATA